MNNAQLDPKATVWTLDGHPTSEDAALQSLAAGAPLLVAMHGYGAHERDLVPIMRLLPKRFVGAFLRAPLSLAQLMPGGYSWFPLSLQDPTMLPEQSVQFASAAADAVWAWIKNLGVDTRNVALLGFSQGGVMVTTLMRQHPGAFACGVNLSGFIAPGDFPGDAELARSPEPLFWGRDEADPVITAEAIALTTQWVPEHTVLTKKLYPGIGHGISEAELDDVAAFLEAHVDGL